MHWTGESLRTPIRPLAAVALCVRLEGLPLSMRSACAGLGAKPSSPGPAGLPASVQQSSGSQRRLWIRPTVSSDTVRTSVCSCAVTNSCRANSTGLSHLELATSALRCVAAWVRLDELGACGTGLGPADLQVRQRRGPSSAPRGFVAAGAGAAPPFRAGVQPRLPGGLALAAGR